MATIQYVVNAVDAASATFARIAGSADDVLHKLDEIDGNTATARIALKGDKEAALTIDKLDLKMAKLGKSVAEGKIGVEGQARALLQIKALELKLDELSHKHVTATVDVRVNRQGLRGLLSSQALSGLSPGGGGGLGGALLGGGAVGAGIIGAGLVPSVVGAGLGGLVGGGAVAGGLFGAAQGQKVLNADIATIKQITTGLKTAVGQQKTALHQALIDAQKQYDKDAKFYGPFNSLKGSLQGLVKDILIPLRTVMTPLAGIFTQFGKGLAGLSPQFSALFKASLPFVKQFLVFLLQAGKILLPAFTQALNEMVKSGALQQMTDALVILTKGLATFIVNLGPGMRASSVIFARVATFIGRTLGFLGAAFTVIAKVLAFDFPAAAKKGVQAVMASFTAFRSAVAASLAADERIIAAIWDTIWRNTVTRAANGVRDVIAWFRTLPARAVAALTGLGHSLYAFAHAALTEFLNGFKAVAGTVIGWLSNFAKSIIGVITKILHMSPPHPGSAFYDLGASMMHHLAAGIKANAHHAANAARGAAGGAVGDTGARSGSARLAQSFAASILPRGWSFPALLSLWNQESGWNAYAVNPSSGAYGIPQSLGHGHPYNLGDYKAQIEWGIRYIAGRYGSSQAAWAHEQRFNWYDRGGWLPPGVSLAYNATGHPEQVLAPGSMARVEALLAQILHATQLAPAATAAGTVKALNSTARGAMGAR